MTMNTFSGRFLVSLLLCVLLSAGSRASGAPVPAPGDFYVAAVEDARQNRKAVHILQGPEPAVSVPLAGAAFPDIRNRLRAAFPAGKGLRPVVVQISELRVSETAEAADRVRGQVRVTLRFLLQKPGDRPLLTTLSREAVYRRGLSSSAVPLSALKRVLDETMKDFRTWMNREAATDIRLARAVKFSFRDHTDQQEDTVYYAPDRPLTWADFRDTPRTGRFAAEVFAGFGFDQEAAVENGVIRVTITTRVFVPKSASWVRPDSRNARSLNHEQRHFDLAKIQSERFKQQILAASLTPDNYEGYMGPHYLETLRELTRVQQQYDGDTRHGADPVMQEHWNRRIDRELRELGVKN